MKIAAKTSSSGRACQLAISSRTSLGGVSRSVLSRCRRRVSSVPDRHLELNVSGFVC